MKNCKPILLVEDDDVDAMTVRRAFKELKISNSLIRSVNGEEALKYLKDQSNETPCVILLDLNMPKMNGIEFLKVAKADDELRQIPVVVLTTSKADEDIVKTYNLHANAYITKPVDLNRFVEIMHALEEFWFTIVKLPPKE